MHIDSNRRTVKLDPRDPWFFNDPYPAYEAIRAEVPVFKWEDYGHWCFARHGDVSALLRDRRFGRQILHVMSREAAGLAPAADHLEPFYALEAHSLLELEPPDHTRLRNLVNRAFLTRAIEHFRPRIAALAHELIDGFANRGETELIESFATPIPVTIIAELLGVPLAMAPQLLAWSHDMVAMYQSRRDRAVEEAAVAATQAFSTFLRDHLRERRREPGADLLSQLIAAETQGARLSEDGLVATAILLLNAGHEATVHAIGNGVKALIEHRCQGEPMTGGHVEETLRFDAPLHLFTRHALEDVDYAGIRFRQGEVIGLLLGAANRDPERYAEPGWFHPERAPNPHVSFGAGIHFCIGAPLARLELETAFSALFTRLPNLRLAARPRYRDSYHFHGLEALHLAW